MEIFEIFSFNSNEKFGNAINVYLLDCVIEEEQVWKNISRKGNSFGNMYGR